MLIALEGEELASAGRTAEQTFIAQMKRRREALGLSQEQLADGARALGANLYQQTIAKLEAGQRALKFSEADILAQALDTTVAEMLSRAIGPVPSDVDSRRAESVELEIDLASRRSELQRVRERAASLTAEVHAVAVELQSLMSTKAAHERELASLYAFEVEAEHQIAVGERMLAEARAAAEESRSEE